VATKPLCLIKSMAGSEASYPFGGLFNASPSSFLKYFWNIASFMILSIV
jgi:hypothetical protein